MLPVHPRHYQLATELMAWIARGLICILLLAAPWPYAMANWSSQVWLVPVVGAVLLLASLVALARRISVGNPVVWTLAAVLVVGLVQIIPLPASLWESLSPTAGFLQQVDVLADEFGGATEQESPQSAAPNAAATVAAGVAQTISIHPLQTRTTLCVFAMGLAMLISSVILFRDRLSVAVLLGAIAVSGLAVTLLGIYQAVVAGDWTLLEVPKATSFATFFSRNSAPQFLACAFAATAGVLGIYHAHHAKQQEKTVDKRYRIVYPSVNVVARFRRRAEQFVTDADVLTFLCLLAMVLLFIGVLVANSRGGTLAFVASGLLVLLVYGMGKQAGWTAAVVTGLLVMCAGLFLYLFGINELVGARLDTLSEEAYKLDNVRLQVWQMAFSQPSAWALGSGLGTFHFALLPAYAVPHGVQFYHAENIYVELASNAGVITLIIVLGGLGWLFWQLLTKYSNSNTARATRFACLFALLAIGLQNIVDFSLMLPAVFLPLAALIGAYLGTRHQVKKKVRVRSDERAGGTRSAGSSLPGSAKTGAGSTAQGASASASSSHRRAKDYAQQIVSNASGPGVVRGQELTSTSSAAASMHSRSTSAGEELPWAPAALVVCLLLISAAVAVGYRPLSAFAFAEQLTVAADSHALVADIAAANDSHWADFPESALKIGRMRQRLAERQIIESPRWQAELNEVMRESLAQPQFFSTVFHGTDDPQLIALKEHLEREPAALENLANSQFDMRAALAACPLDWRASWGLMRADMGEMSPLERRRNYARILLTCRVHLGTLQAAGTHALMVGETAAGLRIWRELLPVYYTPRFQVLALLNRFLTIEQLISILPEDPLQRLEMAKAALESYSFAEESQALVETVDLDDAMEQAHYAADWELVAWAAQQQGRLKSEIQAWQQAVLADPRNHSHSYSLALALERDNRLADALTSINEALERSPETQAYLELKQRLQASGLEPSTLPDVP